MTRETKSSITIEIEVPVSGTWARAEPDVGLNEGFFEDAQIDFESPTPKWLADADDKYAEQIQEALALARQDELDNADARHDAAVDAQMHHDRENKP